MATLLEIRDRSISIYKQYETLFHMLFKFALALSALQYINNRIGYQDTLTGPLFVVLIALICALIPYNATVGVLALVILLHLNALAMEAMVVGLILFMLLFLLYFRFAPQDTVLLVLTPLCNLIGIPYLIPIVGGLLFQPISALTSAVGVIIVSFINFVHDNETAIGAAGDESDLATRFRFLIDGVLQNKAMLCMVVAVCAAAVAVYLVRRLTIHYAWYIATGIGALLQVIIILVGDMLYATGINIGGVFLGVIGAALVCIVITFYAFNLDYSRVENTQFEDDDYYYYVRAVPKNVYVAPRRTVKQINTSRHVPHFEAANLNEDLYDDDFGTNGESYENSYDAAFGSEQYAEDGAYGEDFGAQYGNDAMPSSSYGNGGNDGYADPGSEDMY